MNKWILIVLVALLGLYSCTSNRAAQDHVIVEKAELTTKVAILPLTALDSSSRYITKILTVRDLELTFDKYANYTLLDMEQTAQQFEYTGYIDVEGLETEEMKEVSENLAADVIIFGTVSESRAGIYNISMRFYSTISEELKQISFNVGKEKSARWKALDDYMMTELDNFVSNEMDKIFNIATNYYNLGNYAQAEQALKQVVALKPDKVDAYYYLGNIYLQTGREALAEENFLKAHELDPEDQRSAIALIDLYEKTNQPTKRIALMEELATANDDEELWLAIGNLYAQQGDNQQAERAFRQSLSGAAPDQSRAALIAFLAGKAQEYHAFQADIAAIDDRTRGLGNLKAAAQDAAGRLDFDAVEALLSRVHEVEVTIAAETDDPQVRQEMNTKALDTILALKEIEPENEYVYLNLAAIYLGQNRYNEAETNANLTIARNPSIAQAYIILSVIYQTRGTEVYNNYLDLDRQASQAVGREATRLKNARDAAQQNARSLLNRAKSNLESARSNSTEPEVLQDINNRISRINQLLNQL